MKNKHLLLMLLMALLVPWAANAQETLTVNDGTTTNGYVPVYGYYADAYNKCEFVQPAANLADMNGATINGVTFYASQSSVSWGSANFQVFLTEVGSTSISAFNGPGTVVYEGALSISGGTMTVNFSTPYTYNGGNLLVGVYQTATGSYVTSNWYGVSATGASGSGYSYSSLSSCSFSQKNFLPKMTFTYEVASTGCDMPTSIAVSDITPDGATVAWEGEGSAWNLRYKASTDADFTLVEGLTAQTYSLDRLASNTSYSVGVQTVCGSSTSSFKSTTFTTANPCAAPTNLVVDNITNSSATLSWTPGYQETEWTVKYKKSTDSEYTTETVNRNPTLTLRNLDGCTQYNVQIYNCESYLSGNFVTAAGIPFTESFATSSIPAGWTRYTGLLSDVMSGTALTTTTSGWNFGTSNGVFDIHTRVNIYSTNCKYWLVTPSVPMENNVQLTFDLALTKYSGTLQAVDPTQQLDDKFIVLVSTDNMATWTILRQWDNAGSEYVYNGIACSATGEAVTIDLSSFAGQDLVVAFYGESTASGGDNNLHIDNVSIDYIPDCAKPTGLAKANVTAHTVDLSWTSDASGWVVAYKTAEESEFREVNVTANSYTLTNLEPETAYTVKVKANCGGVYSDWSNPVSFTTGIACPAPTGVVVSNINGHGATITWSEVEGAWYQCAIVKTADYDVNNIEWSESFEGNTQTVNNLDPETGYTFALRKDCTDAEDGYSQIVTKTFTTTVACPAPTVAVSNITAYTAEVSCTNTDAEYFNVMLDTVVVAENVTMPYTLIDLEPNTSYTVKVQAICGGEDGESAYSNGTSFMTAEICPEGMVCIGTGTGTSTFMPFHNFYNYSLSEQIYTAAEIGQAGAILSIDFYKAATTEAVKDLNIYMVATNKDEFASNTDWISVTASDLVYSGTVTFVDNDWTTINLDNPFIYDGTSNVCVVVDNNTGDYVSSTNFRTFNDVKNRTLYYQSDGTNPDPLNPTITASGKTATKNRIRLAIGEPPACPKPTGLAVNYNNGITATVTWEGDATSYNIDVNGTVTENVTSPYTLEGLELATTYNVMVQAVCSAEELSEWTAPVSFTTSECMEPIVINYSLVDSYGDGWNGASITILDEGDNVIETLTVNGSSNEGTLVLCGSYYMFVWNTGSYDGECSWSFTDANGEVLFEGQGGSYNTGDVLYEIDNASCKKPTDLAVNYINGITATVTWEGDATSYNIDVNGTVTENVTSPYTLEGLELATTYNVMVQAVCSAEELSEWTAPVSFTTDLCMPENQCEITFELTDSYGDSWNGAYIEVVDVTTGTTLAQMSNQNLSKGEPETETYTLAVCDGRELQFVWHSGSYDDECSFVIKDLNDEVIVEGISSTLPVNYTVNCTVITCKKPKDLAAFDINKKSVVLSWTPGTEDQNAWRIAYMSENDTIYSYKNVTANPYTLKGLTPETSYTVKVRANCGGGDYSNWSDEISFTTAEACPAYIYDFAANNITTHQALLSWNGDYNSYQVRYKKVTETEWSDALSTNEAAIALSGLEAGTTYDYQVQGYCADVDVYSEWVDGYSFETQSICEAPQNLYAVPGINSAVISWTGYQSTYQIACGETVETVYGTTYTMEGLESSHEYTVTVIGLGEDCGEYESATLDFTTGIGWDDPTIWADPENPTIDPNTVVVIEPGENPTEIPEDITIGDGSYIVIEPGAEVIYEGEDPIPVVITFDDDDDDDEGPDKGKCRKELPGGYKLLAPPVYTSATQQYVTVESAHLMDMPDDFFAYDLYSFDLNYPAQEWRNYKADQQNFNLNWKQGYLYYGKAYSAITWTGLAVANTNNSVAIDLDYNEANTYFPGLNLIGNPFTAKGYPNKEFYVLNSEGNEVISASNNYVKAARGFFVLAEGPGETCTVYTEAPVTLQSLNITLNQECDLIDAAAIRFNDTKNLAKVQLNPNHTKIYMPFEGKDYAILQGEGLGEMPINIEVEENGTYTLNFASKEVNFSYLHLIDNLTGVETNLLKTPSYTFNANVSDYASRFRLVYATGSSVSGNGSFGFVNEAGNLCIFGIEGEATLQVVDVTGRVLSSKQFSGSYESKLNVAPGVYMLRLINGNDVKVQKIVME